MKFKLSFWLLKLEVIRMKREKMKLENKLVFLEDRIEKFDPIVKQAAEYLKVSK